MKRTIALWASSAILAGFAAGASHAGGTAPGTTISNSFDLSYDSGGDAITISDVATADIDVDRKVEYTFASTNTPKIRPSAPGEMEIDLTYVVSNTGNAPTVFDIDVDQIFVGGNGIELTYDPTASGGENTWYIAVYDPAAGPASGAVYDPSGINGVTVPVDGMRAFVIVATLGQSDNGDQDNFTLTTTPISGGTAMLEDRTSDPKVVFNTPNADGTASDTAGFLIQAPILSATKTVQVVRSQPDGSFNCSTQGTAGDDDLFLPGACIEYRIEISNAASANAAAEGVTFKDVLPSNMTYQGVTSDGIVVVAPTSQVIDAEVDGDLAPGETVWLAIRAIMN